MNIARGTLNRLAKQKIDKPYHRRLIGINLTGVNVGNAIFVGATYDSTTILTFDPVGAGMVYVPEMSPLTLIMLGLLIFATLKHSERPAPAFAASAV